MKKYVIKATVDGKVKLNQTFSCTAKYLSREIQKMLEYGVFDTINIETFIITEK